MDVHNVFLQKRYALSILFKSVLALWIRPIRRYALMVNFRPALWRYGVLFPRKRYRVMGTLKKVLWRYEGSPTAAPSPRRLRESKNVYMPCLYPNTILMTIIHDIKNQTKERRLNTLPQSHFNTQSK